ncbi:MAG TPA: helix-turn-helix transcriptional regulator [Streptosporangiaceae bacterium]|jgi:hypothetical protein|nr:helix-turn-helix transcriptional regulator [Streptosporangiaceae bacterium]
MRQLDPSASPAAFFGAQVRAARERRKPRMTLAELAAFCHCDPSVVSRVEGAEADPPDGFAEGCNAAFPEVGAFFTDLLESTRGWEGATVIPPWFKPWVDIEKKARVIRWHERMLIPGLLQTPEYIEAVLSTWKGNTPEHTRSQVEGRIDRQRILERETPPELWCLIGEHALYNRIGTEPVMAAQLAYLADISTRPHITVQVVPVTGQFYSGLAAGAFFIGTVDNVEVAHFETVVQGMTVHEPDMVKQAVFAFDRLRAEALPVSSSQELIAKVGESWRT